MNCPVCKTPDLVMSERKGIEIDYCPECRGIWLDRGELDKILERSVREERTVASDRRPQPSARERDPRYDRAYKGKRKHWLMEIFD